jgi:negative regulator of replication initiation
MLNLKNTLEHTIEDRLYQFVFSNVAPIGEIHDALTRMKSFVAQQILLADQAEQKPKEACNADPEHQ